MSAPSTGSAPVRRRLRSTTTRIGEVPSQPRRVSRAPSAMAVAAVVTTAPTSERNFIVSSEVTAFENLAGAWPGLRRISMNPSADCAHFIYTKGRRCRWAVKNTWFSISDSRARTPAATSTPASRRIASPRPLTLGLGSPAPTTTFAIPVSTSRRAHGGVLP